MKKTMAMLLALVLMVGALALPASAADTVASRVYLDAPAQVTAGENAAVALYVNGNTAAGGVQGTITYNATDLTYQSVTLRGDVTALGNTEDVTVKVDGSTGTIKFVLLSNVTGGEAPADAWLTVNFAVNMTAAGASTDVSLSDVVVSNKTGEGKLSPTVLDTEVKIIKIGTKRLRWYGRCDHQDGYCQAGHPLPVHQDRSGNERSDRGRRGDLAGAVAV